MSCCESVWVLQTENSLKMKLPLKHLQFYNNQGHCCPRGHQFCSTSFQSLFFRLHFLVPLETHAHLWRKGKVCLKMLKYWLKGGGLIGAAASATIERESEEMILPPCDLCGCRRKPLSLSSSSLLSPAAMVTLTIDYITVSKSNLHTKKLSATIIFISLCSETQTH